MTSYLLEMSIKEKVLSDQTFPPNHAQTPKLKSVSEKSYVLSII